MREEYYGYARFIKTGYELSKEQVKKMSPEEQAERKRIMLETREEIHRINLLDDFV